MKISSFYGHEYKLSIAMVEFLFGFGGDSFGVDGIAYPSVRSDFKNVNIALLPRAVDRMYRPLGCQAGRIIGHHDGDMPTWRYGAAKLIHRNGRIEWDLKRAASAEATLRLVF